MYLNETHGETDKKLQDNWDSTKDKRCSTFDYVNQIFGEIARNIDNSGLCSLLSASDEEKIECINKLAPTQIAFARAGDGIAKTPDDLDRSQWQRLILIDVCFVKAFDQTKFPIICIKYRDLSASRVTFIEKEQAFEEFSYLRTNDKWRRNSDVWALKLEVIAMLSNLLHQNRKVLNQETLKDIEKKYISPTNQGKWKCSTFVPSYITDEQSTKCVVCCKDSVARCFRCKQVGYCSNVCQRTHWKAGHSTQCKKY